MAGLGEGRGEVDLQKYGRSDDMRQQFDRSEPHWKGASVKRFDRRGGHGCRRA